MPAPAEIWRRERKRRRPRWKRRTSTATWRTRRWKLIRPRPRWRTAGPPIGPARKRRSWCGNRWRRHLAALGAWRAPSVSTNTFARESHMDTLAAKAGVDPLEFRLRHLSDARMRRVLEAVAKQFGWKAAKAPSGRGAGVACGIYSDAYAATMAEVAVDRKSGHVQVKRVVSAVDVGLVINPDGLRQQMEGCIAMGLGYTLTEEVHFKDGEVLDRNFDSYLIPRFSWMPKVETILIDNPGMAALGAGEPPIITRSEEHTSA